MPSSKTAKKTPARGKKPAAKKAASPKTRDFGAVFKGLHKIMSQHESSLVVKADTPRNYTVVSPKPYNKKELYFGAVMSQKNYVSYHFFPIYVFPELAQSLSPELKKRKQGKACFNFSSVDDELFKQLDALTRKGFDEFRRRELI